MPTIPAKVINENEPLPQPKARKHQLEEAFQEQKRQFWSEGPIIETDGHLFPENPDTFDWDFKQKIVRNRFIHCLEQAYYKRDYQLCYRLATRGLALMEVVEIDRKQVNHQINETIAFLKKSKERL